MECVAFPLADWAPRELDGQPIGEFYDDYCHFCYPFNLTGQPVISVPMGPGTGGLPLGLQIAGRRFEDDLVLRAAAAWERAQPWETAVARARARAAAARRARRRAAAAARRDDRGNRGLVARRAGARGRAVRRSAMAGVVRAVRAWSPRAGELEVSFQVERVSVDPDGERRRARRAEIRRRQVAGAAATGGAALLVAVAGVGIWAAATLASGSGDERSTDSDRDHDDH